MPVAENTDANVIANTAQGKAVAIAVNGIRARLACPSLHAWRAKPVANNPKPNAGKIKTQRLVSNDAATPQATDHAMATLKRTMRAINPVAR